MSFRAHLRVLIFPSPRIPCFSISLKDPRSVIVCHGYTTTVYRISFAGEGSWSLAELLCGDLPGLHAIKRHNKRFVWQAVILCRLSDCLSWVVFELLKLMKKVQEFLFVNRFVHETRDTTLRAFCDCFFACVSCASNHQGRMFPSVSQFADS